MANMVTCCRIICSLWMLFFPAFSGGFYALYGLCGFTDMIDGAIARKTNTVSRFGAALDTVADFVFALCALARLLPVITQPRWICLWIAAIAAAKILQSVWGLWKQKRWMPAHTLLNKITGMLLFLWPLSIAWLDVTASAAALCFLATLSALHEGRLIRLGREVT